MSRRLINAHLRAMSTCLLHLINWQLEQDNKNAIIDRSKAILLLWFQFVYVLVLYLFVLFAHHVSIHMEIS